MTDFKIRKRRASATLTLANGEIARGSFFLCESAADHSGPERVDDLLNEPGRFVPFQIAADMGSSRVVLLSRNRILMVHLPRDEAALVHDSVYEMSRREPATLLLTNGERITGEIHITGLSDHARVSEYTNIQRFIYFERPSDTVIVNFDHVVELVPLESTQGQAHG